MGKFFILGRDANLLAINFRHTILKILMNN